MQRDVSLPFIAILIALSVALVAALDSPFY